MITLFSYPELCGVADNNGYGLKVYAFLKLCKVAFRLEHIMDASRAPRGQLPFIVDDEVTIGDSDATLAGLAVLYPSGAKASPGLLSDDFAKVRTGLIQSNLTTVTLPLSLMSRRGRAVM